MGQKSFASLKKQQGIITIEFIFCAPLLLALLYFILTLNGGIETRYLEVMRLRNQLMTGKLDAVTGQNHEANSLTRASANNDRIKPRLKSASWNLPGNESFTRFYQGVSTVYDTALPVLTSFDSAFSTFFKPIFGLNLTEPLRLSQSLVKLYPASSTFYKMWSPGIANPTFWAEQAVLTENGYHPNKLQLIGIFGGGIGMLKAKNLGEDGAYGKSNFLQTRCMTRLVSDNLCDTTQVPIRPFLFAVRFIASSMAALDAVLAYFTGGSTTALKEGGKIALKEAIDAGIKGIVDSLVEGVKNQVAETARSLINMEQFENFQNLDSVKGLGLEQEKIFQEKTSFEQYLSGDTP